MPYEDISYYFLSLSQPNPLLDSAHVRGCLGEEVHIRTYLVLIFFLTPTEVWWYHLLPL